MAYKQAKQYNTHSSCNMKKNNINSNPMSTTKDAHQKATIPNHKQIILRTLRRKKNAGNKIHKILNE